LPEILAESQAPVNPFAMPEEKCNALMPFQAICTLIQTKKNDDNCVIVVIPVVGVRLLVGVMGIATVGHRQPHPPIGQSVVMVYEIDGTRFSTLEECVVIPESDPVTHNLDAFDDVLRGGFGTPDEGFTLLWKNHEVSRRRLGYPETVRQLELRLARCHPTNRIRVSRELEQAQAQQGPTVFEWLTEIIRDHGPGGRYAADGVDLLLD